MNEDAMGTSNNPGMGAASDEEIIAALREAAEPEKVFESNRDWNLEKMRCSVGSRGDFFDRKGGVVFERDGEPVLRACVCDLPATVGSGEKADCRLLFEGVSRIHCRLLAVGSLVRLEDAGSKNGTWLNGRKIEAEDLCEGDELRLGALVVRVRRG